MYHCFWPVASMFVLDARTESREKEVDRLVEHHVAAPEEDREHERRYDDDDGRADDLVLSRPRDLLHLAGRIAEELLRRKPPLPRLRNDRVFCFSIRHVDTLPLSNRQPSARRGVLSPLRAES